MILVHYVKQCFKYKICFAPLRPVPARCRFIGSHWSPPEFAVEKMRRGEEEIRAWHQIDVRSRDDEYTNCADVLSHLLNYRWWHACERYLKCHHTHTKKKICWRHQSESAARSLFGPYCNKLFFSRAVKLTRSFTGFCFGLGFFLFFFHMKANTSSVTHARCVIATVYLCSHKHGLHLMRNGWACNTRKTREIPREQHFSENRIMHFFSLLSFPVITSTFVTPSCDCKWFTLVLSWNKKYSLIRDSLLKKIFVFFVI